ncbi:MAG: ATP-binding protein [Pseudomonadales bacterium]|nr:ATP-binding protein [Pseudomonadales bacterium]
MPEPGLASCLESLAADIEKAYRDCLSSSAQTTQSRQSAITLLCRLLADLRACFSFCKHSELARYCQQTSRLLQQGSHHPGHARIARAMTAVIACCQAAATGTASLELAQTGLRTRGRRYCLLSQPASLAKILVEHLDQLLSTPVPEVSPVVLDTALGLYAMLGFSSTQFPALPAAQLRSRLQQSEENRIKILLQLRQGVVAGTRSHSGKTESHQALVNLLCSMLEETLQSCRRRSGVAHLAYYQLSNTLIQIEKIASLLDWNLSTELLLLAKECIWRFLRYRNSSQGQSIYWIAPGLQQLLQYSLQHSLQNPGTDVANNLKRALKQQLVSVAILPGLAEQGLLACCQAETRQHLSSLYDFLHSARATLDTCRVESAVCVALYKLAANFHALGDLPYHEQADCFRILLSICMQQQIPPSPRLLGFLNQFLDSLSLHIADTALPHQAMLAAVAEPPATVNAQLLRLETELAISNPRLPVLGFDLTEQLSQDSTSPSSLQLAASIRHLLNAEADLRQAFQSSQETTATVLDILNNLSRELHWLIHGAHDLKVYRVEALASVMLDVCDLLLAEQDILLEPSWQKLLLLAHRKLDCMLNQAAAHQDVDSARHLIRRLYQQLDARRFQPVTETARQTISALHPAAVTDTTTAALRLLDNRCLKLPASSLQQLLEQVRQTSEGGRKTLTLLRSGTGQPARQAAVLSQLKRQQRCLRQLQANLLDRLTDTLDGLYQRLQRQCRQLGNDYDKQVHLRWHKTPLRLPRTLLDYLQPVLEQLVHNAIRHGLEPTALRRQAHKPDTSSILLQVSLQQTDLVLVVEDDGSGGDQTTIEAACQQTDSGLGRVRHAIANLGGQLQYQSTPHQGSRFSLVLPRMLLG